MQELKDTQSEADTRNISIDRVGVKGLRFPIQIQDKLNRIQSTVATVSLAVDLPEEFKGVLWKRCTSMAPCWMCIRPWPFRGNCSAVCPPAVPMWKWNSRFSAPKTLL